ncbi:hypothetical protein Nepgr_003984 [Nepenthes gracilis]|uniref:Uncharacterized protein n=1 Tax=Nepenthes gracilis TaxID=150966 RepID=A0AAD3XEM8_NEPGR|nr:hypothetical protein Nepgr_003984 [Nepenthes gracilis]
MLQKRTAHGYIINASAAVLQKNQHYTATAVPAKLTAEAAPFSQPHYQTGIHHTCIKDKLDTGYQACPRSHQHGINSASPSISRRQYSSSIATSSASAFKDSRSIQEQSERSWLLFTADSKTISSSNS